MKMPTGVRCEHCCFWRERTAVGELSAAYGWCRRFPARVEKTYEDWCGEFVSEDGARWSPKFHVKQEIA